MSREVVNFGGNVRFTPAHRYAPTTEVEVLAILDRHAGGKVRVVGALHSWSAAVVTADALIDLRHFDSVDLQREPEGTVRATVGGGCRIKHLLRKLHRLARVTMPSVGLITEQTIAGAISSGTHGSGRHSLSHYIDEVRVAAYDAATGRARVYTWADGLELRAARCALGCVGVILSVRFRCVPVYDVAESVVECDTLDEVLAGEDSHPLQQFYLVPHRGTYLVQRRTVVPPSRRTWAAALYRCWWFYGIDVGLHLVLLLLVCELRSNSAVRWFFRQLVPRLLPKNITFTERPERMLVMEHELFRHLELEAFVPARHLRATAAFVRGVLAVFDGGEPSAELAALLEPIGMLGELSRLRGLYTQHYPVTFRCVLPDDTLISPSAGWETWYAVSFITYDNRREGFLAVASFLARSLARLFAARLHWGKHFPLDGGAVDHAYPALPEFREVCRRVDPRGVFRNQFVERVLFSPADSFSRR